MTFLSYVGSVCIPLALAENEWAFVYIFFVDNLFDNPALLENVENFSLLISWRIIGTDVTNGSWLVLAISYLKLSTINKLEINK